MCDEKATTVGVCLRSNAAELNVPRKLRVRNRIVYKKARAPNEGGMETRIAMGMRAMISLEGVLREKRFKESLRMM